MKNFRIYLLLCFLSLALFSGCKEDDSDQVNNQRAENLKALGESAEDLLSDDIYDRLVVEIVYSNGFRPKQLSLDTFRTFLNQRLNKPGGISIIETMIDPPTGEPYSISEIRDIESNVRTRYTNDNTIAVYVFFANGNSSNDTQTTVTLGSAYQNTSIVIYQETLQSLDQDLFLMEATTLRHEFGHILGLVDISGDDIHPTGHLDPDSSKHCMVEGCLMYFASTIPPTIANPTVADIPALDPLCIEDLQAKGGK
ncbi:membrane metalloprotease [Aureitalea sp. L0-47]|uniref:membrane metalloprotease n=1 Tax=Aureitalea sp. L0-47 TaxID=2816962 RepID=UPI002237CBBB|nr:membrane metalloprotease [Aureitalea sp. L0-47]MCW5520684.1 membrane metalloprotease [Aureitalea sp. L0-47]